MRWLRAGARVLAACALLLPLLASAQSPLRVIESLDAIRTTTHIDVVALFNCRARYMSHTPSGEADAVRVRMSLPPECGEGSNVLAESAQTAAISDIARSVELVPFLGREVEVVVQWTRTEKFVVLPTADQRGLRLRLLRPGREASTSRVVISEPAGDLTTAFAINLDSSREPFDATAVESARTRLKLPAYVSTISIDEVRWHRLRVGPVLTRFAAERALLEARLAYPRAWLAIADETVIESSAAEVQESGAARTTSRATADVGIEPALTEARTQLRRRNYDGAIELLTKYLESGGAQRAEARELLGLARERNGQLAHAKAEYETFLREHSAHANASRVRRRLQALRTSQLAGRSGAPESADDLGWRTFGGVAQTYRRDSNEIATERTTADFVGQHAILTDVDGVIRRRGLDFDIAARLSAGYGMDLLTDGPGDRVRVSSAFVEIADRDRGWSGRLGRQSRTAGGLLGVFDGAYANYQLAPHLTLDAALGMPVESTREAPSTDRLFEALALGFGVFGDAWEPGVYVVNQSYDGVTDRLAVGAELRYFQPGQMFVGFADYDVHFQELNSAVLIGALQLPARWTVNLDLERRNSPMLTTRNSLIGQPVPSLDELFDVFNEDEVRQLALDRTAQTELYSVTLSRPFAERLQVSLNMASSLTGATEPSGGVEGIPSNGRELVVSMQLLAASLMRAGDLTALGLRHQSGGAVETSSFGLSSRIPVWGAWRILPQVRVDRRTFATDDSAQWIYAPSLRVSLQGRHLLLELEGGAEFASRELEAAKEEVTRYFVSLGYRWSF